MSNELEAYIEKDRLTELTENIELVKTVMKKIMKNGEHFGTIPGCGNKPTLFKSGAEKLCTAFRLAPTYEIHQLEKNDNGHREYEIITTLTHIPSGNVVGQGVGSCSSQESKYAKTKKLSDIFNTVLKMAKKRSLVDAVLTATAASDIFTQDLEDIDFPNENNKSNSEPKKQNDDPNAIWSDINKAMPKGITQKEVTQIRKTIADLAAKNECSLNDLIESYKGIDNLINQVYENLIK